MQKGLLFTIATGLSLVFVFVFFSPVSAIDCCVTEDYCQPGHSCLGWCSPAAPASPPYYYGNYCEAQFLSTRPSDTFTLSSDRYYYTNNRNADPTWPNYNPNYPDDTLMNIIDTSADLCTLTLTHYAFLNDSPSNAGISSYWANYHKAGSQYRHPMIKNNDGDPDMDYQIWWAGLGNQVTLGIHSYGNTSSPGLSAGYQLTSSSGTGAGCYINSCGNTTIGPTKFVSDEGQENITSYNLLYCGDGVCQCGETSATCSADCIAPTSTPAPTLTPIPTLTPVPTPTPTAFPAWLKVSGGDVHSN